MRGDDLPLIRTSDYMRMPPIAPNETAYREGLAASNRSFVAALDRYFRRGGRG